ncbi:glycosyltransferase family 2 protein [Mesonia sp. K4-1]|uniref:glycosyltransferase family 2 protein n=1 Tax=Mesonia sp. K4-1 TaxID=2602760 RepID=UPI0011CB6E38|nr:glycosyltransferase family 2 protein [Mesonia sp. K4-1]TXK72831.1 glycosyltransferase family 2 protein [Mesonia sp. K4-1]
MQKQPLVSIIIPTYNRAHLIGETLDSIIAQNYQNWECIVVDDGSTDHTAQFMKTYCEKDPRIQYYHRPEVHLPGGNGARNYGFKLSKGEYIQWFDSDDLMLPKKIDIKLKALQRNKVDFVISRTKYFNHPNNSFFNYEFESEDVDFLKFSIDYVRWLTPDLFVKKHIVDDIHFNEHMKAGQEYNYNCKLLLKTTSFYYVKEFLTLRRFTTNSIQGERNLNDEVHQNKIFESNWYNYLDIKEIAKSNKFNRYSLLQCVQSYLNAQKISLPRQFHIELIKNFPIRFIYFYMGIISKQFSGRFYFFYKKLKAKEQFNTYKKIL